MFFVKNILANQKFSILTKSQEIPMNKRFKGFRLIPVEEGFFPLLNQSATNVLEAARIFHTWLSNYGDTEANLARVIEIEHQGDQVVHEILSMLSRTFLPPMDGDDIRGLTKSLDDVLDNLEAAARAFVIYEVEEPIPEAVELSAIILKAAEQIAQAVPKIEDKKRFDEIMVASVEIHRLENEADAVNHRAMARLVKERTSDLFELYRWEKIIGVLENAADSCEDVADALLTTVQKYV